MDLFGQELRSGIDARAEKIVRPSADHVDRTDAALQLSGDFRERSVFEIIAADYLLVRRRQSPNRLQDRPRSLLLRERLTGRRSRTR